jgi:hypothetical protein
VTWDSLFSDTPISSRSCAAVPCSRSAFRWLEPPSGASSRRKGPGPGATTGLTRLVAKIPLQKEYVCVWDWHQQHQHHRIIIIIILSSRMWIHQAVGRNALINLIHIYIYTIYIYIIYAHTYIHTLHYITYIQYIHTLHYIHTIYTYITLHYIHTIYTYINNLYYRSISFSLLCPVDYW